MRNAAIVLLLLNGITAIFGGYELIAHPDGSSLHANVEVLESSPFNDFLIPGIILLLMNGILSLVVMVITLIRIKNFPFWIIIQGMVLIGWITVQFFMVSDHGILQLVYFLLGFAILFSGILLEKKESKRE